jgi:hypothetical protein
MCTLLVSNCQLYVYDEELLTCNVGTVTTAEVPVAGSASANVFSRFSAVGEKREQDIAFAKWN